MYFSFLLQFPYRIHSECLSAYWEASDDAVADASVVDSLYVVHMKANTRDESRIFERMAFLRLVHVSTPVSVSMFFSLLNFRFDYIQSNIFPADTLEFGHFHIGVRRTFQW